MIPFYLIKKLNLYQIRLWEIRLLMKSNNGLSDIVTSHDGRCVHLDCLMELWRMKLNSFFLQDYIKITYRTNPLTVSSAPLLKVLRAGSELVWAQSIVYFVLQMRVKGRLYDVYIINWAKRFRIKCTDGVAGCNELNI